MTQTIEQQVQELQTAVTRLEAILGAQFYDNPLDPSMLKPENTLPNGRYPYMLSDYQLRLGLADFDSAIADLRARMEVVEARPAGAPAPYNGNAQESFSSDEGAGIMFISDTNFSSTQRVDDNGNKTAYPQVGGIVLSEDGGFRRFQNVVFPGNGEKSYIPDPTRVGVVMGFDRLGNESLTYYYAGAELSAGKWEAKEFHKGQRMVFVRDDDGKSMKIFLPQVGAELKAAYCDVTLNEITREESL